MSRNSRRALNSAVRITLAVGAFMYVLAAVYYGVWNVFTSEIMSDRGMRTALTGVLLLLFVVSYHIRKDELQ